ncbi:MAG TPA: hypothetical protein VIT88_15050 [Pyrinomonadaceae bacterium]
MRKLLIIVAVALVSGCQEGRSRPAVPTAQARADLASARPATTSRKFTRADFEDHVTRLKKRLPSKEFSIVIQEPFVVVGDEGEIAVQQRAEDTVKWAVDRLKQDFFTKDPDHILEIWLFKDEASYEKHTQLVFNDTPTTPFGYYSPVHKALIMNIATGGGTLVHEIVHPFVEANFPACPPWLNEGLGSLYEQSGEENGHIHGYTNWRLPGLQQAIKSKTVPSFKLLTGMTPSAFYNDDRGTNYAQARYLCYYLQKKGLLVKFYKEFHANQKTDLSGYATLQKVLGESDMDQFKKQWEKFVLGLRQGYEVTVE